MSVLPSVGEPLSLEEQIRRMYQVGDFDEWLERELSKFENPGLKRAFPDLEIVREELRELTRGLAPGPAAPATR